DLGRGRARMLARFAIEREPRTEPDEIEQARHDERALPTHRKRERGHEQWRDDGADVRAGVEDPDRERALALRKPLLRGRERGRVGARLAERERDAHEREAE